MTMEQNLNHRDQTLRDVIAILQQYLEEAGPCDHAVNICVCGIRSTLDDFGTDCYHRTGGAVGWPNPRFEPVSGAEVKDNLTKLERTVRDMKAKMPKPPTPKK